MADFKGSHCLSVLECASVFEHHYKWAHRLLVTAATKGGDGVEKVAFIMGK